MSPRLSFVRFRLKRLRDLGVTAPLVVKEFLGCRIAPLQRHSRPMWALIGDQDRMRLQESGLPADARRTVLEVLAGDPSPGDLSQGGCCLYNCSNRVEFAGQMPPFDEWGLRPIGLEGSRENPVCVFSLLAASVELAPRGSVGAGGERCRGLEMRLLRCRPRSRLLRRHLPGLMTFALR